MFERFTSQARRVVVLAQEEARDLGHGYIGTEHILLGLLAEHDGVAAQALTALDVSLEAARHQVQEIIGEGAPKPGGHIPFTQRTKKVLELSLREALHLGDNDIGSEHILLGLIREGDGVGVQVLERLGATTDQVRAQVLDAVRAVRRSGAQPGMAARAFGSRVQAEQFGGRAGEVRGRLEEIASRLDEISGRLAAIENLLAGSGGPARKPPAPRKPAAGGRRKPPGGAAGAAGATETAGQPPGGGAEPSTGDQPEPPAAQG